MNTEVTKSDKKSTLPVAMSEASWGKGMGAGVDASDVLIPKLLIMQPISELVVNEKAKQGEIVRSTTGEALGGKGKPVGFIPLSMTKTWVIMEKVGNKFEFRRIEAFTPDNADLPWEWTEKGTSWQRNQSLNLFALLPSDILKEASALAKMEKTGEMPDADDALLPVVIQFTRTSFKVGKEVATHFAKSEAFGIPAAAKTLALDTVKVDGEKGAYFIYSLSTPSKTPPIQLAAAKKWFGIVTKQAMKVDNRDLETDAVPPPEGPQPGRQQF